MKKSNVCCYSILILINEWTMVPSFDYGIQTIMNRMNSMWLSDSKISNNAQNNLYVSMGENGFYIALRSLIDNNPSPIGIVFAAIYY